MAAEQISTVVLLSIHPRYAEEIFAGRKRVEFRKAGLRPQVKHVVVYATSPIAQVIGYFEVGGIEIDSPRNLWGRFSAVGGIDRESFDSYYLRKKHAVAIRVKSVTRLTNPLPLQSLGDGITPPQSYRYLANSALSNLLRLQSEYDDNVPRGKANPKRVGS